MAGFHFSHFTTISSNNFQALAVVLFCCCGIGAERSRSLRLKGKHLVEVDFSNTVKCSNKLIIHVYLLCLRAAGGCCCLVVLPDGARTFKLFTFFSF